MKEGCGLQDGNIRFCRGKGYESVGLDNKAWDCATSRAPLEDNPVSTFLFSLRRAKHAQPPFGGMKEARAVSPRPIVVCGQGESSESIALFERELHHC